MKLILFLLPALFMLGRLHAQVTIGSSTKPNNGVLLDLKENGEQGVNSARGMLLPRVQLTTISSLDDIQTNLDKDEHVGLTVYVPEEFENSCPGIYVWMGTEWQGINTESFRLPEFTTVDDIDGNKYTAKIFNRKGCKGGTYWFTSNLRTTRKNDGTPFHRPLYFTTGRAVTLEYPFDEDNITNFYQVRSKSDISTSTDPSKMITFFHNDIKVQMTQNAFVTKFGLQYTYYMAMPRNGESESDVKICPKGWKVPVLADWVKVLEEVSGIPGVTSVGTPYLFPNNDIYEPDGREIFQDEEQLDVNGDLTVDHPSQALGAWIVNVPKNMGGFPVGDTKNSGLNIYPAGSIRVLRHDSSSIYEDSALDASFGSRAFILEKGNGAIGLYSGRKTLAGGMSTAYKNETEYGNVRCIKVVE